jgi:signal transduction histidine kinase
MRVVGQAEQTVDDLHSFVRQFYRRMPEGAERGESLLDRAAAAARLRRLLATFDDRRAIELSVEPLGSVSDCQIITTLFDVVIVPLVVNSIEAIGVAGRGGRVSVEFGYDNLEGDLIIRVADDGPGWPVRAGEIGDNLLRGRSFSTKGQGRGGGLLSLDRLIRKLGGNLTLDDRPGGGALVHVLLSKEVVDG